MPRIPDPAWRLALVLALGAVAAPVVHAGPLGYSGLIDMPAFRTALAPGEIVTRVTLHLGCVDISDIRGVPGGWAVSAIPHGEDYDVDVSRAIDAGWREMFERDGVARANEGIGGLKVGLQFRGDYSDCASWRMDVATGRLDGKGSSIYRFVDGHTLGKRRHAWVLQSTSTTPP